MKQFFIIWCVVVICAITMGITACAEIYPTTFVVVEVNDDTLSMADYNGNLWLWEGAEDWTRGDIASALMDDNDTDIIYDDTIITIRYSRNIESLNF